jgi:hypothetical protein
MQWLLQQKDIYWAAWKAWMFRGSTQIWQDSITPRKEQMGRASRRGGTPGNVLQQLLGEWQQRDGEQSAEALLQYTQDMEELELESISWITTGEWIVETSRVLPRPRLEMTPEEEVFWPTFEWANNPWIGDKNGTMLAGAKFKCIQNCSIAELHIRRLGEMTSAFEIPAKGEQMHQQAKLRRWGLAILLNAPQLQAGRTLEVGRGLRMRHPTHLEGTYSWTVAENETAVDAPTSTHNHRHGYLALKQQNDGIHWRDEEERLPDAILEADRKKLSKYETEDSSVFYAHPAVHSFP